MAGRGDQPAPSVSVVLPTRNRLHYLRESVASVRGQELRDLELIVVDDASDDGTGQWLAGLDDERVSTVRLDRRLERSAARNAGLERARGRYVLFLDDDDRLTPAALRLMAEALDADPSAVVAAGRKVIFDDAGNRKPWAHPRRRVRRDVLDDVLFGWVQSPGECLWRADVLREVGAWRQDLSHGEDQELWMRIGARGPAVVIPEVVLEYRRHGAQVRVADAPHIEAQLRADFVAGAPPALRERAARVAAARTDYREALEAQTAGEATRALRLAVSAGRRAPQVLRSPLAGPALRRVIVRNALGAMLGRRGRAWLERAVWELRKRRGRAIEMQQWADEDDR